MNAVDAKSGLFPVDSSLINSEFIRRLQEQRVLHKREVAFHLAEVEKYGEYFADYCLVKPGITGLWQVSGRSRTSYPERVQLDRRYANSWSFRTDLKILLKTFSSVMNQDGAY